MKSDKVLTDSFNCFCKFCPLTEWDLIRCFLRFNVVVHVKACYCFVFIETMFVHKVVLHLVAFS